MTPPFFLCPRDQLSAGGEVLLAGPDGRHAAAAHRLAPGERVDLGDGAGLVARCTVVDNRGGTLRCAVLDRVHEPAPAPRLVVVQALAKGERASQAVAGLAEVGADAIVPWAASRSVVRWTPERAAHGLARWRAVARAAGKQARRAWLPEVTDLADTGQVAARLGAAALGVVLHESADEPLAAVRPPPDGELVLVVGPEGGLTEAELAEFQRAGATAFRLGTSVLRTGTAGVAAAAVLLAAAGRWN